MSESVAGNLLALCLHFGDNRLNARALGDKDVYAVVLVHDFFEAFRFLGDVDFHFGNEHCVDVAARFCESETVGVFAAVEHFAVFRRSRRSKPAAVAPHYFVDNKHARVCAAFADDVLEELCALFRRRPRAEALANGIDVVVNRLGKPDDGEFVVIFFKEI